MHFKIHHKTQYTYSQSVFLEPHTVRLRPRSDVSQHLQQYHMEVSPPSMGVSQGLDAENNDFACFWFNDLYDRLDITTTSTVETLRTNPYEGLLLDGAHRLPLRLIPDEEDALIPYLGLDQKQAFREEESIQSLVHELMAASDGHTLEFLSQLNARLYQSIENTIRMEPGLQSPQDTLHNREGACRDQAVVFMTICRQVGLPARFVSGYQQGDPDEPHWDLHAWAEVFLPGFGWRGYDPTHGLAVADQHIVLATAASPKNAAPVTGSFRGTGTQATLEHAITIHTES